ncbi:RraA family protein [Desertihabitans brevis]|uniref:Putative 4-hydroxy-4-methyl-2-oxoglutarate aldolase n=1 Tax=Desertihabitans brevis TaxID=2268447 RepID=A0A367YVQ9_9ACTN|nr:RraA family protein [Desertihabitans brevis]RCK69976.1 RraA family protein [Desertihabitans brevis]
MTHHPVQQKPELPWTKADPAQLGSLYKFLRVVDVVDALDGIGYFNIGLMDTDVRPLWGGMRFFGEAATIRAVPSNKPMWKLETTADVVRAHGIWFEKYPQAKLPTDLAPGHVVVMDSGGGQEVGFWGSENAMGAIVGGAVGIVTDGYARDTGELEAQGTPVVSRKRGRTIIPGRIQAIETQTTIACGGTQVNPGDIVGADDDGVVVVPKEVAVEVATHARAILLHDMKARRRHYDKLGLPADESVDVEAVEAWYAEV